MEAGGPLSARAFQTSQTRWPHRGASAAEEPRGAGKAPSQKQMIRFSSSKTLASSGFIKFPFRLSEENKGRK